MVVIADASPLNYLVLIGDVEVLPILYGQITIPPAVLQELRHPNTLGVVADWPDSLPAWLVVNQGAPLPPDAMEDLDPGEREAIALAEANQPDALLIIDEVKGREEAERRRIQTTGTLGVLDSAAANGLLHLPVALEKLQKTNFHVSHRLLALLLARDEDRNRSREKS